MAQLASPPSIRRYGIITALQSHIHGILNSLAIKNGSFQLLKNSAFRSVIYGAVGKPSVDPALWYHYGLTIPHPWDTEFAGYQEWLLSAFKKFGIQRIVLEDTVTKTGCSFRDFTKIEEFIAVNALDTSFVAGFQVIRLRTVPATAKRF